MNVEPAVDTVEVFMERRSELLPRLARIAEVIAASTGATVGPATRSALAAACDGSTRHTTLRLSTQSDEVVVECAHPSLISTL